jgi:alkylated DNA repair dioxygenase AlkB
MFLTIDDFTVEYFVEPGDILILTGEARWVWSHGIAATRFDLVDGIRIDRTPRISVTLRKMKLDLHGVSHDSS